MRQQLFIALCFLNLLGCAGEDINPVYFPGSEKTNANKKPPSDGEDLDISEARCKLSLTAKLCVKIKGANINVGTAEDQPLCADTPPIPLTIEGEKISLKGSEFPDIHVSVDIRNTATPLIINGKGDTDGTGNNGIGSWTADGHLLIQNFSFFISVLGMSGEIPNIDLTTDEARTVPDLPSLEGSEAQDSGEVKLVAATVLGPIFETADVFLLGASMQASFEGKFNPPLSECAETKDGEKKIKITKLKINPSGASVEETLPGDNILEISKGTYIAQPPTDVGPHFEETAHFKVTNTGKKSLEIEMPTVVGPFFFFTEGTTRKTLAPDQHFNFQVTFRPDTTNTPEAGVIKNNFSLGGNRFELMGIALAPQGEMRVNQIANDGETTTANIDTLNLNTISVSATPERRFFHCRTITCNHEARLTECQPCQANSDAACTLQTINAQRKPVEEVKPNCETLSPNSAPQMQLNLSGGSQNPLRPGQQTITLQNEGIADLEVKKVSIEEFPSSRSTGEFKFSINPATLPVTLAPASPSLFSITVTYLPKDLIGADGSQAQAGQAVTDKAYLIVETTTGEHKTLLMGKTKVQESPPVQAFFGTALGLKAKSGSETFSFEEITQNTQNLAYPVFFNVSEAATTGVRITEIKIQGEDSPS
ncbi:MAG: hypothetical protein Q7S68_04420, partial [Deltaproteobacteria bacterium]|nr:hypothetical protein [Deltaproteobacteria bacterium]